MGLGVVTRQLRKIANVQKRPDIAIRSFLYLLGLFVLTPSGSVGIVGIALFVC